MSSFAPFSETRDGERVGEKSHFTLRAHVRSEREAVDPRA